jgi:outer membrane protein
MKNILSTLALGALITTAANADFIRLEMGGGVWTQTPNGYATQADGDGVFDLEGTYTSSENESNEAYAWILLKHPLPIIPNVRLEYVSISDAGETTGKVAGVEIPGSSPTTMDVKEYDIIPYYNILDNTFWMTVDLGLDIKIVQSDVTMGAVKSTTAGVPDFEGYSTSDTTVIPLLYLRSRVEIPTTDIGIEADAKAITDGTNTMYDLRAKIDYTFDLDVIKPGIEIGYRYQKIKTDDGSTQIDLDYSGIYAGAMLRF